MIAQHFLLTALTRKFMHYFNFQIKEWMSNTAHLTLEEEAIYLRLILYYYDSEQIIPMQPDLIFRKLRIANKEMGMELLKEFFTATDQGWQHDRCDTEINWFHDKQDKASRAGKASAQARLNKCSTNVQPIKNKELTINNKELNIKASPIAPKVAIPIGVDESLWNDFLTLRRAKKLPITKTALKGIANEAIKAEKSLSEVLQICCERGWAGFKASWELEPKATKTTQEWRTNDGLMMAKASELGLHTVGLQRFEIINKIDATLRSRGL
jgi:uncharacterized protein YdaU (DUF1376 family)